MKDNVFTRTLANLGDTYAWMVLGSVLTVWLIVVIASKPDDRPRNVKITTGLTALSFGALTLLSGVSLAWRLTLATGFGLGAWMVVALVLPSIAAWTPDDEDLREGRWNWWE